MITPILLACEVDLSLTLEIEPLWLDIPHLQSSKIMGSRMVRDKYVYNFGHPLVGRAKVLLPLHGMLKITPRETVIFVPPPEFLYTTRAQREAQQAEIEEKIDDTIPELERYDFGDEKCSSLKQVSKKLSLARGGLSGKTKP